MDPYKNIDKIGEPLLTYGHKEHDSPPDSVESRRRKRTLTHKNIACFPTKNSHGTARDRTWNILFSGQRRLPALIAGQ